MYIQNVKLQGKTYSIWSGILMKVTKPLGLKKYCDLDVIKKVI